MRVYWLLSCLLACCDFLSCKSMTCSNPTRFLVMYVLLYVLFSGELNSTRELTLTKRADLSKVTRHQRVSRRTKETVTNFAPKTRRFRTTLPSDILIYFCNPQDKRLNTTINTLTPTTQRFTCFELTFVWFVLSQEECREGFAQRQGSPGRSVQAAGGGGGPPGL